jgi:urease accessory protein
MRTPSPRHQILSARPLTAVLAVALLAPSALAHGEEGSVGGFASGLSHPMSGPDHIAAMIAVGLWGAQLGAPAIWALPVMFPVVMAFGGFLGLVGVPLPGVEIGIALSAIVLGAMVLAQARPPLWLSITLVSIFAIFHGYAHGAELPGGANAVAYSIGFVVCTGLLHAAGIGIGTINHLKRGDLGLRALGGVIVASGVYFLWGALA